MLEVYDKVMEIILPTLGPDRRATYSPFLPVSPDTGKVLQVPIEKRDLEAGTITYRDPDTSKKVETPVTGGHVKCQWKADWAMRWVALGIDYEMAGKDLIDSVTLSSKICRALGGTPPEGFNYELFHDDKGQKISKSKGNGIAVEEWLAYATPESLSLYMFQKPKTAKRLYFDVIPKAVDDYFGYLASYQQESAEKRLENPVWHIHNGRPPQHSVPVSFGLLLNLVSASNAHTKDILWQFVKNYAPEANAEDFPELDRLIGFAIRYFEEREKPFKVYRAPTAVERGAMLDLDGGSRRRARRSAPRNCKPSSTRSAKRTRSRTCATGSRRFTRCCSARARGRASARSSRRMALRIRAPDRRAAPARSRGG